MLATMQSNAYVARWRRGERVLTLCLQYLSRPDLFNQIFVHTDVRLGLGWAGVFVAAGTAFYGYKVDFEQSKPVVWAGLGMYVAPAQSQ